MVKKIKFGPAGLGPVKDAIQRLEQYSEIGLKACEIASKARDYGARLIKPGAKLLEVTE